MAPWVIMMRDMGVQPRGLADGVLIVANGPNMFHAFDKALEATHKYLDDMVGQTCSCKEL